MPLRSVQIAFMSDKVKMGIRPVNSDFAPQPAQILCGADTPFGKLRGFVGNSEVDAVEVISTLVIDG